ncbi:4196_t:CDS:2, partial [Funneliformis caledonium]
ELMNEGRRLNSLARREKNENEKNNLEEDKSDLDELIKALKKDKEALTKNRDDKWELYKYLQDKFTDLAKGEATLIPDSMDVTLKRKQNVPTYRNMDDMVKKLRKITPSSYGRSKKNDPELNNLSSLKAEADDFESLGKLVLDMQEFYNVEEERLAKFTSWASKYFNCPVDALPLGGHSRKIKNELRDGSGCPYRQVCASYARFISQKRPPDCYGLHPTFLIYLAGPYLGIAGAIFGDKCVVEPLTPLIPLMHLESLKDYYNKLCLPTEINADLPRREAYPYPNSFNNENGYEFQFEYKEKLVDDKLLFIVQELTNQQLFVVKFIRRYGADVHRDCAKVNIAPKLIAFEKLAGNWFMVVMEYLLSEHFTCMYDILQEGDQNISFLTQKSIEVANELHKMNYVHGDFRTSNFMISKDRKQVMIVDFDWAGEEGSAKYPHFINRFDSLDWHPDVKEGGKIKKAHYIYFITQSTK